MYLTPEQQAILDGSKGEVMAKVMKTLVMYGDAFGAEKLVPVTSKYNHLVTSFGLKIISPIYDLMNQLIEAGVASQQQFSMDPRQGHRKGRGSHRLPPRQKRSRRECYHHRWQPHRLRNCL